MSWAVGNYPLWTLKLPKPITPGPNSPLTICLRTTSNSALVVMCSQMVTEASRNTVLAPSPHLSPHQRVKVWRLLPLARQTANPSLSFRRSSPTLLPSEELHSLLPSSSSCPLLPRPPRFLPWWPPTSLTSASSSLLFLSRFSWVVGRALTKGGGLSRSSMMAGERGEMSGRHEAVSGVELRPGGHSAGGPPAWYWQVAEYGCGHSGGLAPLSLPISKLHFGCDQNKSIRRYPENAYKRILQNYCDWNNVPFSHIVHQNNSIKRSLFQNLESRCWRNTLWLYCLSQLCCSPYTLRPREKGQFGGHLPSIFITIRSGKH